VAQLLDAAQAGLPPQPRRLTAGSRVTARQAGERRTATAYFAAGGSSGETIYSTTFAKNMRIYW